MSFSKELYSQITVSIAKGNISHIHHYHSTLTRINKIEGEHLTYKINEIDEIPDKFYRLFAHERKFTDLNLKR